MGVRGAFVAGFDRVAAGFDRVAAGFDGVAAGFDGVAPEVGGGLPPACFLSSSSILMLADNIMRIILSEDALPSGRMSSSTIG